MQHAAVAVLKDTSLSPSHYSLRAKRETTTTALVALLLLDHTPQHYTFVIKKMADETELPPG